MTWIGIGILIGIGAILAPVVLTFTVFFGLFFLILLGVPAIGAGIGYIVAVHNGTDPWSGTLVGLSIGLGLNVVGWMVYGVSSVNRRNKQIEDEIMNEVEEKRAYWDKNP
jgi:hypothetical protein